MKSHYEIYKRYHNNKFLGWAIGKVTLDTVVDVALFFGRKALTNAKDFLYIMGAPIQDSLWRKR